MRGVAVVSGRKQLPVDAGGEGMEEMEFAAVGVRLFAVSRRDSQSVSVAAISLPEMRCERGIRKDIARVSPAGPGKILGSRSQRKGALSA